jgi:hypothetical protein
MILILAVLLPPALALFLAPWLAFRQPYWPPPQPIPARDQIASHRYTWTAETTDWLRLLRVAAQASRVPAYR